MPDPSNRRDWRPFAAGLACGIVIGGAVLGALTWKTDPERSAEDSVIYDNCLIEKQGNQVACDALMRLLVREGGSEERMRKQAAQLIAAGFTEREVVDWAKGQGFVGRQLSDAVGISLQDLQTGKY